MRQDIESMVYDTVTRAVKEAYPSLSTASWYGVMPPSFPFAYIVQTQDSDWGPSLTSNHENEAYSITFEVDVYSGLSSGRKAEAKAISNHIAAIFKAMGFRQTLGGRPIDMTDAKNRALTRYLSRYEARVHNGLIHPI